MKLSSLPLVLPIAEWIWSVEEEEHTTTNASTNSFVSAPEFCLSLIESLDIVNFVKSDCFGQVVSKVSGIGIIVGACFNKAPTVMNMLEAQSAEGFSPMSLYTECLFYANSSIYSIQLGHPFTAYGENLVLLVQTMVMVLLMWKFTNTGIQEKLAVLASSLLYTMIAVLFLPQNYRYLLHAFNDIIIIYSGGLQVMETYRVKHTGAQSIVTTSMNLTGEVLRIFTTLEETGGDFNMLLSFGLCATLSITMFTQYFWYQKNTEEFYKKQQQQQQQQQQNQKKKVE